MPGLDCSDCGAVSRLNIGGSRWVPVATSGTPPRSSGRAFDTAVQVIANEILHWTRRAATPVLKPANRRKPGHGKSTMRRVWQKHGLSSHRFRRFNHSRDPAFADRPMDISGAHVCPPVHQVVPSVDGSEPAQANSGVGMNRISAAYEARQPRDEDACRIVYGTGFKVPGRQGIRRTKSMHDGRRRRLAGTTTSGR